MAEIIILILFATLFAGIYFQWKAIEVLKCEYREIWNSIGKPNFINNSIYTSYKLHKFIWKKGYSELTNPNIIKYCSILRYCQIFYLGFLPILFFIFVLALSK
jgi:hypothetical protein